ncbi:hypothetical protein AWB69_08945 [Caballeronia udeis]|uniref:Uncharacterized protein n=1 Tax=Caballeronia udeis TaxID=1232866 RepID=A0A158JWB1_9BURK|nr:hypothetical protein AWB69_08945 [Caballeronia udeis]
MRSAAAGEHRTGEDTAKRTLVRTRWRATVAKQDDELRGLARGGRIPREGKNAARRAPSCERSSHHSRQLDVQKGRQSLLVGVSRKASAESPKGRDPLGARCAARYASGARHSGFRATPGNVPRFSVLGVAVFSHPGADDRHDSDPVKCTDEKKAQPDQRSACARSYPAERQRFMRRPSAHGYPSPADVDAAPCPCGPSSESPADGRLPRGQ